MSFKEFCLGDLVIKINRKNTIDAPVWSVTNDLGFIPSRDFFNKRVASANTSNYRLVPPDSFAYNPARINIGSVSFNSSLETGCVSPMYVVFEVVDKEVIASEYLWALFKSDQIRLQIDSLASGSVRQTLSFQDFGRVKLSLPPLSTQKRIGGIYATMEEKMRLNRRMIQVLKETQNTLLSEMMRETVASEVGYGL